MVNFFIIPYHSKINKETSRMYRLWRFALETFHLDINEIEIEVPIGNISTLADAKLNIFDNHDSWNAIACNKNIDIASLSNTVVIDLSGSIFLVDPYLPVFLFMIRYDQKNLVDFCEYAVQFILHQQAKYPFISEAYKKVMFGQYLSLAPTIPFPMAVWSIIKEHANPGQVFAAWPIKKRKLGEQFDILDVREDCIITELLSTKQTVVLKREEFAYTAANLSRRHDDYLRWIDEEEYRPEIKMIVGMLQWLEISNYLDYTKYL